ncbi:MAG: small acid-soluble spore protein SspI [Bacilli bacterium]|nr:small acid-soluble spore protein SspI [Bacilli bacterium]
MDIDIRKHIINNFKDDDITTLRSAIEESIQEKDEIALPGMGVFMEILWTDSNEEMKQEILNILHNRIKK